MMRETTRKHTKRSLFPRGMALGTGLLLLFASALLQGVAPRPAQPNTTHAGRGAVSMPLAASAFCGTPLAVFAHFHLVDANQHLGNGSPLPTQDQLTLLPRPHTGSDTLTYDPATDTLCAQDGSTLSQVFLNNASAANPPADPTWVQQAASSVWDWIWRGTVDFIQHQVLDWASSFGILYITPAALSYKHGVVLAGMAWSISLMQGMLACLLVLTGYQCFLSYQAGLAIGDMLGTVMKILLTAVAASLGWKWFLPQLIELVNSLSLGLITALGKASNGDFTLPLGAINWLTQPVTWAIFLVLDFIGALLLIFALLVRLALLDVLIIIGPFAILCLAVPLLQPLGRWWISTFFSTLLLHFLMVATMALGSAFIAAFGHASATPMTLFLGLATMYLALKWPQMVASHAIRGSAGAVGRDVVFVVKTAMEFLKIQGV